MRSYNKRNYYLLYTLLFFIVSVFVYGYFWYYKKSFIDCGEGYGDGLVQHYEALCYYARYLREIMRNLLREHRLVIPDWSFSIGSGSDIVTTLNYYVIGDPFNILSVFVPIKAMPYYYSGMCIIRMYCAGVAFSELCFYTIREKQSNAAVLTGSVVYLFCMYGMQVSIKHPYFINPMVFFPLLLLGIEKILDKKNPLLFVIAVAVSACSNFYFFYMLVLLTVLYVLMRLDDRYGLRNIKKIAFEVLRIAGYAIIGTMISMIIFLPVILAVLQDSRFGGGHGLELFYPNSYYAKFLSGFLTVEQAGYWNNAGYAGIGVIAILLLFQKKGKYPFLKKTFIILTVFLLLPVVGYVLNGCSYVANRWNWAYALLIAYIVAVIWPDLSKLSEREKNRITVCLSIWFLICLAIDNARTKNFAFCMGCTFVTFGIIQMKKLAEQKRKCWEIVLMSAVIINIAVNAYYSFSVKEANMLEKYEDYSTVNARAFGTQDAAIAEAAAGETEFFRYAQHTGNNNSTLNSGLYSLHYYWSLSNPEIVENNETLGILDVITHNNYLDFNSRTGLTALANVKYFTNRTGSGIQDAPYAYDYVGTYEVQGKDLQQWDVYRNRLELPFGYTYDGIVSSDAFLEMNSVEKEEAMLQKAYVGEEPVTLSQDPVELSSCEVPYEISCDNDRITCQGLSFVATSDKTNVKVTFGEVSGCELYLVIEGMKYQGCSPIDLYEDETPFDPLNRYTKEAWEQKTRIERDELIYRNRNWKESSYLPIQMTSTNAEGQTVSRGYYLLNPGYTWYAGREDYTVNLGYSVSGRTSIDIALPKAGIYSYKSIKVIANPLKDYENEITRLRQEHLQNVNFGVDVITGEIELSEDKLLCMTIPYAKGWSAYVDGEKAELIKTNFMYSGLVLPKGHHTIELYYSTPGKKIGMLLSLTGIGGLLLVMWKRRHYNHSK